MLVRESVIVLHLYDLPEYIGLRITLLPRSMLWPETILVSESVFYVFDLATVVFFTNKRRPRFVIVPHRGFCLFSMMRGWYVN